MSSRILACLTVFSCLALSGSAQYAQPRLAGGLGGGQAVAGPYALQDTLGQTCVGGSEAADELEEAGFWAGTGAPFMAVQDALTRAPGRTTKIRVTSLLANDGDPSQSALALTHVDARTARGGTVSVAEGWLFYEPPPGLNASDDFTYTIQNADGSIATGSILVLVSGSYVAPRPILRLRAFPDGSCSLWFVGTVGQTYAVQVSSDLHQPVWETLATRQAGPDGLFEFSEKPLPHSPGRFYRAVVP